VHPLPDDKVQHLTNVGFAINAAVSTSTTMSPLKATLGFEPTPPSTATFEDNEPSRTLPKQVKILVEMHIFAHACVKAAQAHMQEFANRHRLLVPFTFGDKVKLKAANLRFAQQSCSKLRDRYIGPFLITEEVSPVAFLLKLPRRTDSRCCTRQSTGKLEFRQRSGRHCATNSNCVRCEAI
jgi:hypothetical protein